MKSNLREEIIQVLKFGFSQNNKPARLHPISHLKHFFHFVTGTLNTGNHLAIGSNTLLPYKRGGAANHYPSKYLKFLITFLFYSLVIN
jgi:hypothetical protein